MWELIGKLCASIELLHAPGEWQKQRGKKKEKKSKERLAGAGTDEAETRALRPTRYVTKLSAVFFVEHFQVERSMSV